MAERTVSRPVTRPVRPDVLPVSRQMAPTMPLPARAERAEAGVMQPKIAVIGVGGAGTNALNHIGHIQGDAVKLIALNTDAQSLGQAQADECLCLGESLTQGRGAGGAPEIGQRAAETSRHHIASLVRGHDLVFVLAGFGGGTGTGAAPVVARIAREMGALTIGMATTPFAFEGNRRRQVAQAGVNYLAQSVDALFVLPNDRLVQVANQGQSLNDAFVLADAAMRQAIAGIVEITTVPGLINVDFADVRAVLQGAGASLLTCAEGSGPDRASRAVTDAMSGGWLSANIRGARRVLFNITGSPDISLFEVSEVADALTDAIDSQADCVFGAVIDPELTDTLRITLIAAGLPTNVTP